MIKKLLLTSFISLISAAALFSQSEIETIAPDRPGFGDAVSIVPKRQLQLETGFWYEEDRNNVSGISAKTQGIGINSTLFRYGLSEKIELRFDYNLWRSKESYSNSAQTGLFPCRLGMKAALTENKGLIPAITFVGMMGMPWTASKDFKPDYVSPDLQLSFANAVNDWFTICYNLGSSWDGNVANPQHYYALSAEFAPTEKIGGYIQVHGSLQNTRFLNNVSTEHLLYSEAGLMYYPLKNIQIDLSGGTKIGEFNGGSISNKEHAYFFSTLGLSWRFPK